MQIFGIIVLALLAGYYLFVGLNTLFLPTQTALARVVAKEYRGWLKRAAKTALGLYFHALT